MFIGHFGLGLAAKPLAPRTSLGTLFLGCQFLDLLWPTFLMLGWERVRIEPGASGAVPLAFEHYPISHSLLAAIGWGVLVGAIAARSRAGWRAGVTVGALVVSHWLLDAIVHVPDLPLIPGGAARVGWGLWNAPAIEMALELAIYAGGAALYLRSTVARDRTGTWSLAGLLAFLLVVHLANALGDAPPSVSAIAWVGQAQWLLVAWAYWVDRHRAARADPLVRNDVPATALGR